jgi:hypothetical protein
MGAIKWRGKTAFEMIEKMLNLVLTDDISTITVTAVITDTTCCSCIKTSTSNTIVLRKP